MWGDSPELAACAWILGVPHPTGYPLYMLAVHIFQALPFGTVIFRAHLFSAICTAAACSVMFLFLQKILSDVFSNKLTLTLLPALISVVAWTLTPVVWSQSRITEVYALFALQFTLTLLVFSYAMKNPRKALPLLAFLFGLMLIHHRLAVFLMAMICLFILLRINPRTSSYFYKDNDQPRLSLKTLLLSLFMLVIPCLLLLYFPIRALYNPAINWYDPDTLERFYHLISGKLYSGILTNTLMQALTNPYAAFMRLIYLIALPFLCFSVIAALIPWGWIVLFKRKNWWAPFTLILFLIYQVFILLYTVGDWPVFMLPGLILLTIPLSFGIAGLFDSIQKQQLARSISFIIYAFVITLSLMPFCVRFDGQGGLLNQSISLSTFSFDNGELQHRLNNMHDLSTTTYANRVWSNVPNGAPLITGLEAATADYELYPLLYQQIVEHRNPLSPLIGAGFIHLDWYRTEVSRKLSIPLEPRHGRIYQSREQWHKDFWSDIMEPALAVGPVYTTSFSIISPAPQDWKVKANMQYLGKIEFDRYQTPLFYQNYMPGGDMYRINKK